jgi:hypothetical protein
MVFQPAVNCANAYVEGLVNGRTVGNSLNFRNVAGAYSQADIDDLADAVDDWFSGDILPFLSIDATYVNTHVRGLASSIDLEADNNDGTGVGGEGAEPQPNNVSWVVSFRTGQTGRSARGRMYMWGTALSWYQANEDLVIGATADSIIAAVDNLPAAVAAVGWEHVILSRFSSGVQRTPNALVIPVTQYLYTDLRVDTRRSRLG